MSENKQVRVCTLPFPLCPYRLPFLCTETGASRSVVFFTACDQCNYCLLMVCECFSLQCRDVPILSVKGNTSVLWLVSGCVSFLVCYFDSSSFYYLESTLHPTLLE